MSELSGSRKPPDSAISEQELASGSPDRPGPPTKEAGHEVPEPYLTAGPRARYVKAVAQMIVGTVTALAALVAVLVNLIQHDPAMSIQKEAFATIGVGLALAAGIELAYTLFTHGPDEALDPVMLGVAAALILQLGRVDNFVWGQGLAAIFYMACLAGLFATRKWLAETHEPGKYQPNFKKWRAFKKCRARFARRIFHRRESGPQVQSVASMSREDDPNPEGERPQDR